MDFVDEENRMRFLLELGQQGFQPFFEVAPIFRSCDQRTEIQRINRAIGQDLGYIALDDLLSQTLGNSRFTHPGFAHQ